MSSKNSPVTVTMKPLTGLLDNRSSTDDIPLGSFRHKENFAIDPDGRLRRARGWVKPYDNPCDYKNWDFHDQGALREPITLMIPTQTNTGDRYLIGGTKTRLIALNETTGAWATIGSGLGNDGTDSLTQSRFNAATLQNKVFFTNDIDQPKYYDLLVPGVVADVVITGLDDGDLTKARRVIEWKGLIIFLNTVEGGIRFASRFRWSGLNNGLEWDSSVSVSDYQDLDYGEVILNAMPLRGALYIFTDKSIWQCVVTIDDTNPADPNAVFKCDRIYTEPRNRAKCLAYPNSLISDGFSFYYLSTDGVYEFSPGYTAVPDRIEWIHRATAPVFKDAATKIDKQAIFSPIAEFVPGPNDDETAASGELHFSWPNYDPAATQVGNGGALDCAAYVPLPVPVGTGINKHTLVCNVKYRTCDYRNYGSTSTANFTSNIATGATTPSAMFLAANGEDFCIKQMDVGDSREIWNTESNTFERVGYHSMFRLIFPFEKFGGEKELSEFTADVAPDNQDDTTMARLRIGTADRALDPNETVKCAVIWRVLSQKPIKCNYSRSAASYAADNVRPTGPPVGWNFLARGRFLFVEFKLENADGSAPTSGGCAISRLECFVKLVV